MHDTLTYDFMVKDVRKDILIGAVVLLFGTGILAFTRYAGYELSFLSDVALILASGAGFMMFVSGIRCLRTLYRTTSPRMSEQ